MRDSRLMASGAVEMGLDKPTHRFSVSTDEDTTWLWKGWMT
jgi:hypothetical protein